VPNWLASLCNRINDSDLTWVGFRALRPAPDQNMSASVVARLCLVYCPLSAAVALCICYLILGSHAPAAVPWIVAGAFALLFIIMQSTLAWAWNHRAARLRAGKKA
jgi:fatty acid desaturase